MAPPHAHGPRFGERGRELAVTESSIQHQASIWSSASSWRQLFHSGGDLRPLGLSFPGRQRPPLLSPLSRPSHLSILTIGRRCSRPSPLLSSSPSALTLPWDQPPRASLHPAHQPAPLWALGPPLSLACAEMQAPPGRERTPLSRTPEAASSRKPFCASSPPPPGCLPQQSSGGHETPVPVSLSDGPGFQSPLCRLLALQPQASGDSSEVPFPQLKRKTREHRPPRRVAVRRNETPPAARVC